MQHKIQLGLQHHQAGQLQEAERAYREVLSAEPANVEASYYLSALYSQSGRNDLAIPIARAALEYAPDSADLLYNLGTMLREEGEIAEAIRLYENTIRVDRNHDAVYNNLALIYMQQQQLVEAAKTYKRGVEVHPQNRQLLAGLADCEKKLGDQQAAIAIYERLLALNPQDAISLNAKGALLATSQRVTDARECFHQAVAVQPDYAEAWNNLGRVNQALGQQVKAEENFRTAIRCSPAYAEAHRNLAASRKHNHYDDDIKAMEALIADQSVNDWSKMYLRFGLYEAFENIRDYQAAFEHLLEANRLRRASYSYSSEEHVNFFQAIQGVFDTSFFEGRTSQVCEGGQPLFIVGMPRSGTSLVEQILASHSCVFGAGELDDMSQLVQRLSSQHSSAYPQCVTALTERDWQDLSIAYLQRLRGYPTQFAGNVEYIADKSPPNFLHIGLIKLLFPNAKIIHCQRDAMATCFSIFSKTFAGSSYTYAYNLQELGQYYTLYQKLMTHWQELFPGEIYTIRYEDLVADSKQHIESILAYCDLAVEQDCFEFYKNKRAVITNSFSQVRKPIYNTANEVWKNYQPQLLPLQQILNGG